ncbi:MAG: hypothetical protein JNL10_17310 [Verrucomicrobiales bacterium]|nr:hypothetical protein [Verrucomicrobiales bacterium]
MNVEPLGKRRRRSLWRSPALLALVLVSGLWIASRVVEGWRWPPGAFVVVGALVCMVGFIYEWITRNQDSLAYRAAVAIAFAAGFVLAWSSLVRATDVTPLAALHFGVPVVGLIGAAVARLRPKGMARALWVTALAQVLGLACVEILPRVQESGVDARTPAEWRGLFASAVIAVLFAGSALLFREAGRGQPQSASPAA